MSRIYSMFFELLVIRSPFHHRHPYELECTLLCVLACCERHSFFYYRLCCYNYNIKLPDKSSIIIYIIIIRNNRLMPMNLSTSFADPKNRLCNLISHETTTTSHFPVSVPNSTLPTLQSEWADFDSDYDTLGGCLLKKWTTNDISPRERELHDKIIISWGVTDPMLDRWV